MSDEVRHISSIDLAIQAQEERNEIGFGPQDIIDRENPFSVYNLCPQSVKDGIDNVPEYLWLLTPREMEKEYEGDLTNVDRMLRHSFWLEYDVAQKRGRPMVMENVFRGVCSRSMFDKFISKTPHRFAYMLKPPENYRVALEEILELGVRELREIIKAPIHFFDKKGNKLTDSKLAGVKVKIVEALMNRLQGMPVHRSMQVTENVNRNYNHNSDGDGGVDFSSIRDVERLEKLVNQLEGGATDGEIVEVGFKDEQNPS